MPPTPASAEELPPVHRAVVTGGARGIGRAIVERLVADGARVVIADVSFDGARRTAGELGPAVHAVACDVRDPASVRTAMDEALAWLGGLDLLVNNAGVFRKTPLADIVPAEWDEVLAVNARGPLLTLQAAATALIASGRGAVVNIASMAAKLGTPGEAHYAASKAALVALTRIAAMELGPSGVTVNAVCPGYVLTDMGAATRTAAEIEAWTRQSPLGRLTTAAEVAAAVAWLASADARGCTGQALNVTSGMVFH